MKTDIIENRLKRYRMDSPELEITAIREITQELILFALSTSEFFTHAAFQGGTCLRIVHGLNRFSEDMDFVLKKSSGAFSWQQYLTLIATTLEQYGYRVELQDKSHTGESEKKAFIKDDSIGKILKLSYANRQGSTRMIRIKLEIDTNPPGGGEFESAFIAFPSPSSITTETLPTLFAGKSHALLCRKYEKGRDWYDFLWYLGNKTPMNYRRFSAALNQTGPWAGLGITVDRDWYINEMTRRIEEIDWKRVKADVAPFISQPEQGLVSKWNRDFFITALAKFL